MPALNDLMQAAGWHQPGGRGPDFYFPQAHPHLHVRVANGGKIIGGWDDIKAEISFIALSFGQQMNTVKLYDRNPPGEQLENRAYNVNRKTRFESALHDDLGVDLCDAMQQKVNKLTGMGIDV